MSKAFDAYMDGTTDTEKIDAVLDADWKVGDIILLPTVFGKEKARITEIDSSNIWYTSLRDGRHSYFNRNCAAIKKIEKVGDSACDGAEQSAQDIKDMRVVHARGIGKWWVEPNLSLFSGEEERKRLHRERKEFNTREEAEKYAKYTGKSFYVVDEETAAQDGADDDAAYACKYILANAGSVQAKIHGLMVSGLPHDVAQKLNDAFNAICDAKNAADLIVMKSKRK